MTAVYSIDGLYGCLCLTLFLVCCSSILILTTTTTTMGDITLLLRPFRCTRAYEHYREDEYSFQTRDLACRRTIFVVRLDIHSTRRCDMLTVPDRTCACRFTLHIYVPPYSSCTVTAPRNRFVDAVSYCSHHNTHHTAPAFATAVA